MERPQVIVRQFLVPGPPVPKQRSRRSARGAWYYAIEHPAVSAKVASPGNRGFPRGMASKRLTKAEATDLMDSRMYYTVEEAAQRGLMGGN